MPTAHKLHTSEFDESVAIKKPPKKRRERLRGSHAVLSSAAAPEVVHWELVSGGLGAGCLDAGSLPRSLLRPWLSRAREGGGS